MRQAPYFNDEYNFIQLPEIYSSKAQNKKQNVNKHLKPIIVNLGDTQYPVIEQVCDQLGWRIQYSQGRNWDIKWTDSAVSSQFLNKMSQHQKINHFPGMSILSRKNNLTKCIQRMQQQYPQDYDIYPLTFLLPYDKLRLKSYVQQIKRQNKRETFIVKPQASCQGRGIFLTANINQIQQYSHCVVQEYLPNPLLYKGLKFDLRVYALVAGCDPLRIYIYNQGLTRFATEKYQQPDQDNMDNLYMHLTNYAINKDHPNYIFNDSVDNLSYGHKKSLAQFFQTLKNMGLKAHQYWADIKDVIIKTMISGQPHLQHQYRLSQPHNLKNNMCFEVLGFDFMIDANGKSYLLQINHTPSFTTDTPLDQLVKNNLVRDTLLLMDINCRARDKIMSEMKSENQRRVFTGKSKKYTPEQRLREAQELQRERDEWEKNHLGSFEKIYPSKTYQKQQKYEQLLNYSMDSYKENTTGIRSRQSPSKFRVKKLMTIHNEDQTKNQPQTGKGIQPVARKQAFSLNRNVSTAAKITTRVNDQLRNNSPKRRSNLLNPQRQLSFQNTNNNEPPRRSNPMATGSIVSLSSNYGMQQFTNKTNISMSYSMKKEGSLLKDRLSQKINDTSLKGIGQIQYRGEIIDKVENAGVNVNVNFNENEEKWSPSGKFLKTKDEELTMFSKMIQKTRE